MPAFSGFTPETGGIKFKVNDEGRAFAGYTSSIIGGDLPLSGNDINASDLTINSLGNVGIG